MRVQSGSEPSFPPARQQPAENSCGRWQGRQLPDRVCKRSAERTAMTAAPLGWGPGLQRPREGLRRQAREERKRAGAGGGGGRGGGKWLGAPQSTWTEKAPQPRPSGAGKLVPGPGARRATPGQALPGLPPQSFPSGAGAVCLVGVALEPKGRPCGEEAGLAPGGSPDGGRLCSGAAGWSQETHQPLSCELSDNESPDLESLSQRDLSRMLTAQDTVLPNKRCKRVT